MRRLLLATGTGLAAMMLSAAPAAAHPLGNFTVNQAAGLRVSRSTVDVDYVLDLAELAALPVRTHDIDTNHDGVLSADETASWASTACATIASQQRLRVGGRPLALHPVSNQVSFPPGTGGLSTLRLRCQLQAPTRITDRTDVDYQLGSYPDRLGWREITATADGTTLLRSSVPATSPSAQLTRYPTGALSTSSDVRSAALEVRPGGPAASGPATPTTLLSNRGVDEFTAAFTDFVGRQRLTIGFALLALLFALVLGAGHALAPGHGKTVMAAYLVGERGTLRQAVSVGLTVATTHTLGVLVLGIALASTVQFAPQRVYGWLTVASGLLLAGVGVTMLRRACRRWRHHHAHHHAHPHSHGHSHDESPTGDPLRWRTVLTMGLAGGLTPSPSAVVVLLGAAALGRAWYGVLLVAAYGLGMAATLTGIGFGLSRLRGRIEHRIGNRLTGPTPRARQAWRALPVLTSALVLAIGLGIAATALYTIG